MIKHFYTGSYSVKDEKGIRLFALDTETGALTEKSGFCGVENPSYIILDKAKKHLYALSELSDNTGALYAFDIAASGDLTPVNCVPTSGGQVCYLTLSPDEKYLACAGYQTGTVDMYALNPDGSIGNKVFADKHTGKGKVEGRQDEPHAHHVFFPRGQSHNFYICDLGTDKVYHYELEEDGGVILYPLIDIPAGDGPRHIIQSPTDENIIYLVCEISFTLHTLRLCGEGAKIISTVSTLPNGLYAFGGAGAIRLSDDGKYLYVSNRVIEPDAGHNSVVRFEIDQNTLLPTNPVFTKTGVKMPRDINIFGDIAVIGSQTEHKLLTRRIKKDGVIAEENLCELDVKAPSCITNLI